MQARLNLWLAFAVFLCSSFATAHSLSQNGLKQITRRAVIERQKQRIDSPLRPRSSPTPCSMPSVHDITSITGGFQVSSYTFGAIMDLSGYTFDTFSIADVDFNSAIDECSSEASDGYNGFELYFETDTCLWVCVAIVQNPGYAAFAVQDANTYVTIVYDTVE